MTTQFTLNLRVLVATALAAGAIEANGQTCAGGVDASTYFVVDWDCTVDSGSSSNDGDGDGVCDADDFDAENACETKAAVNEEGEVVPGVGANEYQVRLRFVNIMNRNLVNMGKQKMCPDIESQWDGSHYAVNKAALDLLDKVQEAQKEAAAQQAAEQQPAEERVNEDGETAEDLSVYFNEDCTSADSKKTSALCPKYMLKAKASCSNLRAVDEPTCTYSCPSSTYLLGHSGQSNPSDPSNMSWVNPNDFEMLKRCEDGSSERCLVPPDTPPYYGVSWTYADTCDITGSWGLEEPPECSAPAPCFAGTATVVVDDGGAKTPKAMHELKLGDNVSCVTDEGKFGYCEVYDWRRIGRHLDYAWSEFHVDPPQEQPLRLNPAHVVFVATGSVANSTSATLPTGEYRAAGCIAQGDMLVTVNGAGDFVTKPVVRKANAIRAGAYSPMVKSGRFGGRIVVDGVVATSFMRFDRGNDRTVQAQYMVDAARWSTPVSENPQYGAAVNDLPGLWNWPDPDAPCESAECTEMLQWQLGGARSSAPAIDGRSPWWMNIRDVLTRWQSLTCPSRQQTRETLGDFATGVEALLDGSSSVTDGAILALYNATFINFKERKYSSHTSVYFNTVKQAQGKQNTCTNPDGRPGSAKCRAQRDQSANREGDEAGDLFDELEYPFMAP